MGEYDPKQIKRAKTTSGLNNYNLWADSSAVPGLLTPLNGKSILRLSSIENTLRTVPGDGFPDWIDDSYRYYGGELHIKAKGNTREEQSKNAYRCIGEHNLLQEGQAEYFVLFYSPTEYQITIYYRGAGQQESEPLTKSQSRKPYYEIPENLENFGIDAYADLKTIREEYLWLLSVTPAIPDYASIYSLPETWKSDHFDLNEERSDHYKDKYEVYVANVRYVAAAYVSEWIRERMLQDLNMLINMTSEERQGVFDGYYNRLSLQNLPEFKPYLEREPISPLSYFREGVLAWVNRSIGMAGIFLRLELSQELERTGVVKVGEFVESNFQEFLDSYGYHEYGKRAAFEQVRSIFGGSSRDFLERAMYDYQVDFFKDEDRSLFHAQRKLQSLYTQAGKKMKAEGLISEAELKDRNFRWWEHLDRIPDVQVQVSAQISIIRSIKADWSQLYDPFTGEMLHSQRSSRVKTSDNQTEVTDASGITRTYKMQLREVVGFLYAGYTEFKEKYNRQTIPVGRNSDRISLREINEGSYIVSDSDKARAAIIGERYTHYRDQFLAVGRAFLLNEDPAYLDRGFMLSAEEGLWEALGYSVDSNRDLAFNFVQAVSAAGIELSEDQRKAAEASTWEQIGLAVGGSIPMMVKLAVVTWATSGLGTLAEGEQARRFFMGLFRGNVTKGQRAYRIFQKMQKPLRTGLNYELAGAGFLTGVGENLGEAAWEGWDPLSFLSKRGLWGKFGHFFGITVSGGIGGTIGEFAGQFAQELWGAGGNITQALENTFGPNLDAIWQNLLVTGTVCSMFPAVTNLVFMRKLLKEIETTQVAVEYENQRSAIVAQLREGIALAEAQEAEIAAIEAEESGTTTQKRWQDKGTQELVTTGIEGEAAQEAYWQEAAKAFGVELNSDGSMSKADQARLRQAWLLGWRPDKPVPEMFRPKNADVRKSAATRLKELLVELVDEIRSIWNDASGLAEDIQVAERALVGTDGTTLLPADGRLYSGGPINSWEQRLAALGRDGLRKVYKTGKLLRSRLGEVGNLSVEAFKEALVGRVPEKIWESPDFDKVLEEMIEDMDIRQYDPEIQKTILEYESRFPGTILTRGELAWALKNGYTINPKTGMLNQPADKPVDYQAEYYPEMQLDLEWDSDILNKEFPEIMKKVKERRESRQEYQKLKRQGADQAKLNEVQARTGRLSEEIAEAMSDEVFEAAGFTKIYPPEGAPSSKSGDVDRIFTKKVGDRYLVLEVKGGESELGSRELQHIWEEPKLIGKRAEQGHGLYLVDILREMINKGERMIVEGYKKKPKDYELIKRGEEMVKMVEEIQVGLLKGQVDYVHFRQRFKQNDDLRPFDMKQFNFSSHLELLRSKQ